MLCVKAGRQFKIAARTDRPFQYIYIELNFILMFSVEMNLIVISTTDDCSRFVYDRISYFCCLSCTERVEMCA
jgi:hypothetical protein